MPTPEEMQQITNNLADDVLIDDPAQDSLFAVAAALAEESLVVRTAEGDHDIHGVSLKIGGMLMPLMSDQNPVVTIHQFHLPPTAAVELLIGLSQWLDHYNQYHLAADDVYGNEVRAMIDMDGEDW